MHHWLVVVWFGERDAFAKASLQQHRAHHAVSLETGMGWARWGVLLGLYIDPHIDGRLPQGESSTTAKKLWFLMCFTWFGKLAFDMVIFHIETCSRTTTCKEFI